MKIIILNGSPRKNGATSKLLHEFENNLLKLKNVEIEFINISDINIETCKGCCRCYKTGTCFIKDDAEALSSKIESADGLIIGSPTYASNISGQLKTFIDRGHFVIEQLLHDKYALSVVTGENYGSGDASKILNKLLKYSGAKLSGKITYNLPFNSLPTDDRNICDKCSVLSKRIRRDIESHKAYVFQSVIHKIIFNIGIKPFVIRKGNSYDGVLSRWKRYNII